MSELKLTSSGERLSSFEEEEEEEEDDDDERPYCSMRNERNAPLSERKKMKRERMIRISRTNKATDY